MYDSDKKQKDTAIFLLHGLGSHAITFLPMKLYLNYYGYSNVHCITYPVDSFDTINESVEYVDKEMSLLANKEDEVIIVGQSMGGVVGNNMHTKGWIIKKAIYIGSPLHGANLLNQIEGIIPTCVRNYLYKKPYGILQNKEREQQPPHNYHTISMGWFNTEFDGCVYKNETMLSPSKHTHLQFADHRTIFANPRLWMTVYDLLETE